MLLIWGCYLSDAVSNWIDEFNKLNPVLFDEYDGVVKKTYTLPLWEVLNEIDNGNKYYYRNLPNEKKTGVGIWLLMRTVTCTVLDKYQPLGLLYVNELVNRNFSCLSPKKTSGKEGHTELQWMLLTLCGNKAHPKRQFIKSKSSTAKNKLDAALLTLNPLLKEDELDLLKKINTQSDFEQYFRDNGIDDATISNIFKVQKSGK